MKNIIIIVVVLALAVTGYVVLTKKPSAPVTKSPTEEVTTIKDPIPVQKPVAKAPVDSTRTVLGKSVAGNQITAYHFGTGEKELLFVGGIHGGYEWNTVLVAYELMDYLKANPNNIPKNVKVTVIPVLNPDGLKRVVGTTEQFSPTDVSKTDSVIVSGRFNENTVDLNRNFDCDWKQAGVWQKNKVSGGTSAFSEPESKAMKDYVEATKPTAVVIWYSAGGGVFASNCHNGVSKETNTLTKTFAIASGYKAYQSFDFYETTGDMANWLAKINTPAISVLLTTHKDTEWKKNQLGVEALLQYYAQ